MNADGSGRAAVTSSSSGDGQPAWSPDGTKIVFLRGNSCERNDVYVINSDGSGATKLVEGGCGGALNPVWSPDGAKIAFAKLDVDPATGKGLYNIYVMNADGSGQTRLTDASGLFVGNQEPAWAPDGAKIAFQRDNDVYTINVDGSGQTALTSDHHGLELDWAPIPNAGPTADLAVALSGPTTAKSGRSYFYRIRVTNLGPATATNVVLRDTFPARLAILFVLDLGLKNACRTSGQTVTCNLGTLASGAAASVFVRVRVNPGPAQTIGDTANVSGAEFDPNLANNSATVQTAVVP
jgi:uncharacterized repeat protein (TIGR01451 family)